MQPDRKIALLELLTQRGRVTAGELAVHFGVTTRTIYRDIEQLEQSGTPVYMTKGKGGGVHLVQDGRSAISHQPAGTVAARLYIRPEAAERAMSELSGWQQQEDGSLLCDCYLPDNEQTINWLLSYGLGCVVLESQSLRQQLAVRLRNMVDYYI